MIPESCNHIPTKSPACPLRRRYRRAPCLLDSGVFCTEYMCITSRKAQTTRGTSFCCSASVTHKPSSSGLDHKMNGKGAGCTICNALWEVVSGESIKSCALRLTGENPKTMMANSKTKAEMGILRKWKHV